MERHRDMSLGTGPAVVAGCGPTVAKLAFRGFGTWSGRPLAKGLPPLQLPLTAGAAAPAAAGNGATKEEGTLVS